MKKNQRKHNDSEQTRFEQKGQSYEQIKELKNTMSVFYKQLVDKNFDDHGNCKFKNDMMDKFIMKTLD